MLAVVLLILALGGFLALGMIRAPIWAWAAAVGVLTLLATGGSTSLGALVAWVPFVALAVLSIPAVRRKFVVAPVFATIRKILPKVSDTEAQALEATLFGLVASTDDMREGTAAFLQKRQPEFKGR